MKTVLLHDEPLSGNGNYKTGGKRFGRGRIAGLALIALAIAIVWVQVRGEPEATHFAAAAGSTTATVSSTRCVSTPLPRRRWPRPSPASSRT